MDQLKRNAASRLYSLLTPWKSRPPGEPAMKGWTSIFSIDSKIDVESQFAVVERLHDMYLEIGLLRRALIASNRSAAVYDPTLKKVERAISPSLIVKQSDHIKQHLTEEVFTGLGFCSELLPAEEEEISEEKFKELASLIGQVEMALQSEDMPIELAELMRKHIRLAELALAKYPIVGARGLQEAVKIGFCDLVFHREELRGNVEAGQALKDLWGTMNKFADGAIKVYALKEVGGYATRLLADLKIL